MSLAKPNTNHPFYKWEILSFLWVAFFLNQADRQIFNVLLTSIKADLMLTDAQMGFIATTFNFAFAILVPISGLLGDRISKRNILVFSILLWSIATMCTGFSSSMLMFIIFRSLATGMGEALFGPAYVSTIASYHKETRALAMSIHQTSYYIGVVASSVIATYVASLWGWRSAFVVFGAMGVIWGLLMLLRMRDKPRIVDLQAEEQNSAQAPVKAEKIPIRESFMAIFSAPTAIILVVGFSGLIFVLNGFLTWMPAYLQQNLGFTMESAAFNATFWTHISAFVGIILAGRLSDKLSAIKHSYRMLLQASGLLLAIPFILMMGSAKELWVVYIGLAGFGFTRAFFDANTYAVMYDVIPEKHRASASGTMCMIGFGIGSLSSWIIGALKPIIGLSTGISMLALVWLPCSLLLLVAYKFTYEKDYKKAQAIDATDTNRLAS